MKFPFRFDCHTADGAGLGTPLVTTEAVVEFVHVSELLKYSSLTKFPVADPPALIRSPKHAGGGEELNVRTLEFSVVGKTLDDVAWWLLQAVRTAATINKSRKGPRIVILHRSHAEG